MYLGHLSPLLDQVLRSLQYLAGVHRFPGNKFPRGSCAAIPQRLESERDIPLRFLPKLPLGS